ncbi:DUF423 domain-containing protein [Kordiimonas lacus]|uniref:Uncharacterized membrane protein YgdD, TMEM256/DUF423 family n=1 Tax=Kordiimonas lacus TaxID=637679 RepID=A0A1G7DNJ5_9PROT|nr:DUF423 domain-containing protein [Kordiimonas lacus]SDE53058.1 Uncharacterized membrane protein YgdD, TMEM256/DUF423 family [Kordiimonas lacus]
MISTRRTLVAAGLNGAVATGLAAVGAHALPASTPEAEKAMFAMATQFHLFHALALLGLAALSASSGNLPRIHIPVWLFQIGILAFSGSLYVRILLGPGSLGVFHWITPLGGLALIAGWLSLLALRPGDKTQVT